MLVGVLLARLGTERGARVGPILRDAGGPLVDLRTCPTLPGAHNAQNAACAWAACRWFGLPRQKILDGIIDGWLLEQENQQREQRGFQGLPLAFMDHYKIGRAHV